MAKRRRRTNNWSRKRKKVETQCTCLFRDECKQHKLTPDKRLKKMDEAILEVRKFLDGEPRTKFTPKEYMDFFSCVHSISAVRSSGNYISQLYEKFIDALEDSILDVVLPSLEGKEHAAFLTGILEIWSRYKQMAHWLSRFFYSLRLYCLNAKRTQLIDIPYNLFCDWVFDPLWSKLQDEVICLINLERQGMAVNRDLIKDAIDFIVEIESKGKKIYLRNFEEMLLANTASRYFNLVSKWLLDYSFHQYMEKAMLCFYIEERKMSYCLPQTTMINYLEVIRFELLDKKTRNIVELLYRQ